MKHKKIKFGIFGAGRGSSFAPGIISSDDAELVAVCDANREKLEGLKSKLNTSFTCCTDVQEFFAQDIDAVVLANYATEHAPYAVKLLDSGRHVLSECLAVRSPAEGVALVEAAERNPKQVYLYAENYCYIRPVMEMRRLFQAGAIGELLYCEGSYVHDCSSIWQQITFGGDPKHWRAWAPSTFYCTHSMGPVMHVTGARPERVSAYESPSVVKKRLGASAADGAVIAMQLSNRACARILPWCNWHGGNEYAFYGSDGWMKRDGSKVYVFHEGKPAESYEPVFPFDERFAAEARKCGHSGGDFYTINLFIDAILGRERFEGMKATDVYEAVDMTMVGIMGARSIATGNAAFDIPDFRNRDTRDQFRFDTWAFGPPSSVNI